MSNTHTYMQQLLVSNPLREPVMRAAIQALRLPAGSRGLDAGCGIGLQVLLLAEAVGSAGHVTGLDISAEFLRRAEAITKRAGLSGRVTFQKGSIYDLPFDDDAFDWVWSADCAGYATKEPLALMRELARVVRPGGIVAILAFSSQSLLPGYPGLEARLNATAAGIAPFTKEMGPASHFLRALGWFRDTGLENPTAQTLVHSVHAPLTEDIRESLMALLEMRWGGAETDVTAEDWAEYQRLCRPESTDFILDLADYYAFFTYSLFHGRAVRRKQ